MATIRYYADQLPDEDTIQQILAAGNTYEVIERPAPPPPNPALPAYTAPNTGLVDSTNPDVFDSNYARWQQNVAANNAARDQYHRDLLAANASQMGYATTAGLLGGSSDPIPMYGNFPPPTVVRTVNPPAPTAPPPAPTTPATTPPATAPPINRNTDGRGTHRDFQPAYVPPPYVPTTPPDGSVTPGGGGNTPPPGGGGGTTPPPPGGNGGGLPNQTEPFRPGYQGFPGGTYQPGSYAFNAPGAGQTGGVYEAPAMPQVDYNSFPRLGSQPVDVDQYARQDRDYLAHRGEMLNLDLTAYLNQQGWLDAVYRGRADWAYSPMEAGGGGYSPEEIDAIMRDPELAALWMSPEEAQRGFLTDQEMERWQGDPTRLRQSFNVPYLEGVQNSVSGQMRGTLDTFEPGMRDLSTEYGTRLRGTMNPDLLRYTGRPETMAALAGGETAVRSYLDRNRLALSPEYLERYQFTPADEQAMVNRASASEGYETQAQIDRIRQDAAAQGQTSPLAIAAAENRARLTGSIGAGDAAREARTSARRLALDTTQQRENTRLDAERGYASMGAAVEQDLANRRLSQLNESERMRLASEQGITDRQREVETEAGRARMSTEGDLMRQRVGAEQWMGNNSLDMARYVTSGVRDLETYIENVESARAAEQARNRQATEQANQNQYFTRGLATTQAGSDRARGIADTRQAAQREFRGYLTGQQAQAAGNVTSGRQQQIGAYGTQGGMQMGSTQAAMDWENAQRSRPSTWERVLYAGLQAVGAATAAFGGGGR